MKNVALVVVFTIAVVVGFFAVVMWSRAAREVATFREWGVCIDAPSSHYSIEASMAADFYMVYLFAAEGRRMTAYIGNHPQLDTSDIERAREVAGTPVRLEGDADQFVLVEPEPGSLILHIMFDDAASAEERSRLLRGVRFCAVDQQ